MGTLAFIIGWAEILVLIIICLLLLVVINPFKKAEQTLLPMRWFRFYTYFLLPFWVLSLLVEIHEIGKESISPDALISIIIFTLGLIGLIIVVSVGLYKRRLWGYYLNWVLLAAWTLSHSLEVSIQEKDINKIVAFVIALVISGLLFALPNVIYFRKRKILFT
jgi:hypothetical protein